MQADNVKLVIKDNEISVEMEFIKEGIKRRMDFTNNLDKELPVEGHYFESDIVIDINDFMTRR